ncbi:MAG: hypothetical protein HUU21_39605 [Polyangiaceae bacterium]|nr:hypothetical protein [Polyangiaceae bacterium]NUQ79652.1 hypothetical protein [Polyangiaceae bacterium]
MEPILDLAPGADENPLAIELAERIRARLDTSRRKLRDFRAMRGTFLVVAEDTGESLTLRFDHGRLTIHDGAIGIPGVTFCAPRSVLLHLPDTSIGRLIRRPAAVWRNLIAPIAKGELKIYGLIASPRVVSSFLRLLSPDT